MMRLLSIMLGALSVLAARLLAYQPTEGQQEFVPVDTLPPTEQLPAAPFVVAAYAFVWLALMIYLWSIWRRLTKVEDEMRALENRQLRGDTRR
jgi:CcmD family protein